MGGRDGQYGMADTGLPEPEPLPNAIQPTTQTSDFNIDVYIKTLEMVINSIIDSSRK